MTKSFYHNCLTDDLQVQVQEQLKKLVPEQLSLNEEVAIGRARLFDITEEWSKARSIVKALEQLGSIPESKLQEARRFAAILGERMADAQEKQSKLVLAASSTEQKSQQILTQNTLMLFIRATLEKAHLYFNDGTAGSIEIMNRFEDDLRASVIIQEEDQHSLAIEAQVFEMFKSVGEGESQVLEYSPTP